MWFGEDQRENIIKTCLKRDWTTPSNINNYSTLNNEHKWEDLCTQLSRNPQACTSHNHN
jgi:hypothetical protein